MLPSGLPETVGSTEDLARFLTQSSHYSRGSVRPSAFLPNPRDQATSVSRHGREPAAVLMQLGEVAAGERHLHGAAILTASAVRAVGLDLQAKEPPPRHALIFGWPSAGRDPGEQKARQKELALQLASFAGAPVLFDGR